jgi:hypothetical protein
VAEAPQSSLPEVGRNEFDEWCWRRGLTLRDIVDGLKFSAEEIRRKGGRDLKAPSIETVRLICLPFSDGRRRVPGEGVVELIHHFTGGAIVAAHFYPEGLRGAAIPEAAE